MIFRIVLSLAVYAVCIAWCDAEDPPPNIVLIISDDQAWTDYGFMGHEHVQTPNIDKLASQSVVFRRGYVPTALCRPSLATLITGKYAHQTMLTGNDPADSPENRKRVLSSHISARELLISNIDKAQTLPALLANRGYLSFQSGKWWEGSYERGGFTHGMTRGYPHRGGRHGDDGLKIGRQGMQPIFDFVDTAVEAGKPFFVWYAPFLPHTPHNPPERLLQKYLTDSRPTSVSKYYAMCDWFDETCGQLLDRLDEKNLADNTLVIYVTDNGWIQNPKGNGFVARSKHSPYEGGTRTPIMFRWPNKFSAADRKELCSSIDIAPTILAATDIELPGELPGLNLLPNLTTGNPLARNTLYGELFAHDIADLQNPEASLIHRWVIRNNKKLILTYDGRQGRIKHPALDGRPQLYNLESDPHEETNLAEQEPEIVNELGGLIENWYSLNLRKVNSFHPHDKTARKKNDLPDPDGKPADMTKPVKVFILLGQSNMLGFGKVEPDDKNGTLKNLIISKNSYPHLVDNDGKWTERKDVRFVQVMHRNGKMSTLRNEWLTVKKPHVGIEQQLGHIIGQKLDEPVLILKSCIGNRSLGWDLLPPGSKQFEFEGKIYAGYKESPLSWDKGTTPEPIKWYAGKQYDDDIGNAKKILADIGQYYPDAKDYQVAGFVFWQGHKDQNPAHASRYEQNLVHFIKTLRKDFDAPEAKFVLATIGFGGEKLSGHGLTVAKAQLAVSGDAGKYPEFVGNVKTIDARPYWRDKSVSPTGAGHHYNHNAETYMDVGTALGRAMSDLLQKD